MEGIKVLLVDDEKEFVETLAMRLSTRGFAAATAFSGDDALRSIGEQTFDVVILDVIMPGKDGIETLKELKSLNPLTEVIMLSGHASLEMAIKGMQFGAFDFLVKPPDIRDLVEKINKAYVRKTEHEERIKKAGFVREQLVEAATPTEPLGEEKEPSDLGYLLVIGRESDFSSDLIQYALDISKRMSYQIIALNAAGFNKESFRLFPTAREKVCQDFQEISEKNAALFRQAAKKERIPFNHVVKFCEREEAITEIRKEIGDIDYVVCEADEEADQPKARGQIVAYTPV
jgi:FixJ family two-component response regulator